MHTHTQWTHSDAWSQLATMPGWSFKIGGRQNEKIRGNSAQRAICNATRWIDVGRRVLCHWGIFDRSDRVHPLWWSHSAQTELYFADGSKRVRGYEGVHGHEQPHKLSWSMKAQQECIGPTAGIDRLCILYHEMISIYSPLLSSSPNTPSQLPHRKLNGVAEKQIFSPQWPPSAFVSSLNWSLLVSYNYTRVPSAAWFTVCI
jgi:hypothetical protein